MATVKQLAFIKAICDELNIDEPGERITTRAASSFISANVAKFYAKKARDKKNSFKANNSDNHKYESSFDKEIIGMSTEQNIKNIKNALRHYYGFDIWTGERR